jgi:hypothetical protein
VGSGSHNISRWNVMPCNVVNGTTISGKPGSATSYLQPSRCMQQVSLKLWYRSTTVYGITSQSITILISISCSKNYRIVRALKLQGFAHCDEMNFTGWLQGISLYFAVYCTPNPHHTSGLCS